MIKFKALCSAAILGLVATLFAGCGDGDNTGTKICQARSTNCLDAQTGQVCNRAGTQLVDFTCVEGEVCSEATGTCAGECTMGDVRCASSAAAQYCSEDGQQWIPVACAPGTACTDGMGCMPSDMGVVICEADSVDCQDGNTVKTCSADGSSFDYDDCAANEVCNAGACEFDPDAVCEPRSTQCVDGDSARCKDDGSGYDTTACPDTAPCMDGVCQGSVCVVGETKCSELTQTQFSSGNFNLTTLYTCVDGINWEATSCDPGMICAWDNINPDELTLFQDQLVNWYETYYVPTIPFPTIDLTDSVASCVTPECQRPNRFDSFFYENDNWANAFGTGSESFMCGTPADPLALDAYSICEGFPPYSNLTWSTTNCPAPTECSYTEYTTPTSYGYTAICTSDCTPGSVQCAGSGQQEGTVTCGVDGNFETIELCDESADGYEYVCSDAGGFAGLTSAACMDAVCKFWNLEAEDDAYYGSTGDYGDGSYYGGCTSDGQFVPCNADGTLGAPVDCPSFCTLAGYNYNNPAVVVGNRSGGTMPGYCDVECIDDDQRCVDANPAAPGVPGPYWQTCVNGEWADTTLCPGAVTCFDYEGIDGLGVVVCGGECIPGSTSCDVDDIVTCGDDAILGLATPCDQGVCVDDDGTATCEPECFPGQIQCPGDGSATELICTDEYRWPALATDCADAGTYCRIDGAGVHLGCVQCVGNDNGNIGFNAPDSECNVDGDLGECTPNNTWSVSTCTDATCREFRSTVPYDVTNGAVDGLPNSAYCLPN